MKTIDILAQQYEKIRRFSPLLTPILLVLNLAFTANLYFQHRNIHPYIMIPALFFIVFFFIWLFAHVLIKNLGFYKILAKAASLYNVFDQTAFTIFQNMEFRHTYLPMMKSQLVLSELLPDGKKKKDMQKDLQKEIKLLEGALERGGYHREDFPDNLKRLLKKGVDEEIWKV